MSKVWNMGESGVMELKHPSPSLNWTKTIMAVVKRLGTQKQRLLLKEHPNLTLKHRFTQIGDRA